MTDPLAIPTDKPSLEETSLSENELRPLGRDEINTPYLRFARFTSDILSPTTISIPMVFLVAFYHASSVGNALLYGAITLFFLSIGPFVYILLGVRLGKLSDLDVSKRAERAGPFAFSLISACLGWFVLAITHGPELLITVMILTVITGIVMMLITLRWKISIHASCLAGAATVLTVLYGLLLLPSFLLLALVSWSRVVLHRHTRAQVLAGSIVSITLTLIVLKIRGV